MKNAQDTRRGAVRCDEALPDGGSTYVISDVHGCLDQLLELLDRIDFNGSDHLYLVGDLIDRGPKSAEAISWLVNDAPDNVTFMLGNHELMMLDAVHDPNAMRIRGLGSDWVYNGGVDTATAMRETLDAKTRQAFFRICKTAPLAIPVSYRSVTDGTVREVVIVHAGICPTRAAQDADTLPRLIESQTRFDMVWVRDPWLTSDWIPPTDVMFGHTPTIMFASSLVKEHGMGYLTKNLSWLPPIRQIANGADGRIMRWNGRIDIDCGCCYGGRLACVRLEDGAVWYADPPCERRVGLKPDAIERLREVADKTDRERERTGELPIITDDAVPMPQESE